MARIKSGPSIYIPTDKNIFDALQHKKITQKDLIFFLKKRNILVSEKTTKEDAIDKICKMTFSFQDFLWLSNLLGNPNKIEKFTHSYLKGKFELSCLSAICNEVKNDLAKESNDSIILSQKNGLISLKISYIEQDFTKTELRQRTPRKCEIEIEQDQDGIKIKMPSTTKAKDVLTKINEKLTVIANKNQIELQEYSISLESIQSPKLRTKFFTELIKNLSDMEFDNVSSVDVYNFENDSHDEFSDEDENEISSRLASYINKAALSGEGILAAKEFMRLHEEGFYIYKIIWTAIEKSGELNKVEFEAKFGNASSCNDFMYSIRGKYETKDYDYKVTRTSVRASEANKYREKIRESSERAFTTVNNEYRAK